MPKSRPKLNVVNLKFIGAAFETTLNDLRAIKTTATAANKREVTRMITTLTDLRNKTRLECPQNWYRFFDEK